MNPTLVTDETADTLTHMADLIPGDNPISVKRVDWRRVDTDAHNSEASTTLEYQFPHDWVLIEVTLQEIEGDTKIISFHVRGMATSVEQQNRFSLGGRDLEQYVVLFLSIASPAFSLFAFVLCLKTKIRQRKWLWLIFIWFGIGEFGTNWSTATSVLTPFFVCFPPGGFHAYQYGPWIIYASLPIGAILFLYKRPSLG